MGVVRRPDSSTQALPVISPFPFRTEVPAYTGFDQTSLWGKTTLTPVLAIPDTLPGSPSPLIIVLCPTSTPSTSVIALYVPFFSRPIRSPCCPVLQLFTRRPVLLSCFS